jgi:WD40 repeat protein
VITTRQGSINTLALSPDGRLLATEGASQGTVKLSDTATGRRLAALTAVGADPDTIGALAFSPDGRTLASAMNGTVWLWDVPTARLLARLSGFTPGITSIAFSPDGRTIASGSVDHTLILWDVATRRRRATVVDDDGAAVKVAFSGDGRVLAGIVDGLGGNGTPHLWDAITGSRLATFPGTQHVADLAYDPQGRLVTFSDDASIRWWETTNPERIVEQLCMTPSLSLTPQEWVRHIPDWPYQAICP